MHFHFFAIITSSLLNPEFWASIWNQTPARITILAGAVFSFTKGIKVIFPQLTGRWTLLVNLVSSIAAVIAGMKADPGQLFTESTLVQIMVIVTAAGGWHSIWTTLRYGAAATPSQGQSSSSSGNPAAKLAFVGLLLMGLTAHAQTAAPAPVTTPSAGVSNLYMAGISYNPGASPAFAGTALYAHSINSSGTYAFTLIDALPETAKPFTVTTNVGVGVAQKIATINGLPIFSQASTGFTWTGSNAGWNYSGGVGIPFQIGGKGNWYVMPTARFLKSSVSGGSGDQIIAGMLFGWGQ